MRTIRQDTRLLDQLFRNLDQQSAAEMRKFILEHQIYLDINYPREALRLPAIIILLKSENEAQAYLGDSMGMDSVPEVLSYDDEFEVLGGAASVSTMGGQGRLISGPHNVLTATNNTIRIADRLWNIDQFRVGVHTLGIIGGRGVGQLRKINTNGENTLLVDANWTVVPDTTSLFEIRSEPGEIIGEPRSVYTREDARNIERLGQLYSMNYQIQIITQNPELTVYLHAIVKSIFVLSRQFMEGQGIINFKLGATDFVPRPEYQPDLAYMRALNIDFLYPFDVFTEVTDLAASFNVVLEGCTDDGKIDLTTITI